MGNHTVSPFQALPGVEEALEALEAQHSALEAQQTGHQTAQQTAHQTALRVGEALGGPLHPLNPQPRGEEVIHPSHWTPQLISLQPLKRKKVNKVSRRQTF